MLEVKTLNAFYGNQHVVCDVNINILPSEITAIFGFNGAGKSTLFRALIGLHENSSFDLSMNGRAVEKRDPISLYNLGVVLCPEGREVFKSLTVQENLLLGQVSHKVSRAEKAKNLEYIYKVFPKLQERKNQKSQTLSGGEQQMLALGRSLICKPNFILMDEPFLGLAPVIIDELCLKLVEISNNGTGILMAEQNLASISTIANTAYQMHNGRLTHA